MKIRLNELPEIKENKDIKEGNEFEIFEWSANNGEQIACGDKLVEVMVEKTSIEIAAPASGTLTILVEEDEVVDGDTVIAEIA